MLQISRGCIKIEPPIIICISNFKLCISFKEHILISVSYTHLDVYKRQQLSYAIGVAHPTSIMVDTFGTGKIADDKLVDVIRENFDLRPAGIIKMLDLRKPIYKQTATYGHFGRTDIELPWERMDRVEQLKKYM